MNFPIDTYPTLKATDPNILLQSLGSFWTQMFQDGPFLRGYTIAQAEELIQHYTNLLEVINSYSVDSVPVFHTERWLPIVIKKSEFATNPLLFQPDDAVFGSQPADDPYYAGVIFKFGFAKTANSRVYSFQAPAELKDFSVISNRVFDPSRIFVRQVDVSFEKGVLYFNKDIFAIDDIPKANLIGEDGVPLRFKDVNGNEHDDQVLVLWVYHAKTDQDLLYKNYGYLFDLRLTNDEAYKDILQSILKLFTGGPTVRAIKALSAAFIGVKPVVNTEETITEVFTTATERHVITDKQSYSFDIYYQLAPGLAVGSKVFAGDVLVDAVEYFDNIQSRRWWENRVIPKISYQDLETTVKTPQMSFPPQMFLGNYKHAFTFKNGIELVTADATGNITFPIEGDPDEVELFHQHLNLSKETIKSKLGLANGSAVVINPLDFIFDNFLKYNTALIKFNFKEINQAGTFMSFFKVIKTCLPKHVYFIFYFDFSIDSDEYDLLNDGTMIELNGVPTFTNSDGTDGEGFFEEEVADGKYKTDVKKRLFTLAIGPKIETDHIVAAGGTASTLVMAVKDGKMATEIPPGATTKDINNLLLLDFN
jgi:hypothetical protein